ncbi:hypothetical protein CMV_004950 [Castanea mollissima]|uniref:Uncharacterized protein n=1 Tax=Castanea mollissima TaxID=60419 RepID=A0A8J4VT73_9ROSI|nr:hypothetical protein CMV_004950 [Castanea mollissima]
MEPEPKRRKTYRPPPRRNVSSKVDKKERVTTSLNTCTVPVAQTSGVNLTIQQAKNIAVTEVQQDGCTGNFKIFDSQCCIWKILIHVGIKMCLPKFFAFIILVMNY